MARPICGSADANSPVEVKDRAAYVLTLLGIAPRTKFLLEKENMKFDTRFPSWTLFAQERNLQIVAIQESTAIKEFELHRIGASV